jgi:hypothetical protein
LAKVVYFSREAHSREPGGRLNFLSFETDRIEDCFEFLRHLKDKQMVLNGSNTGELYVMATGGGAYKFYDRIKERLGGVDVLREDEMECLIIGRCNSGSAPALGGSSEERDKCLFCNCDRSRLLHHRDTARGLHLLRNRPDAFRRAGRQHIPLYARQHRVGS